MVIRKSYEIKKPVSKHGVTEFFRNFSLSCGDGILLPLVDQFS